MGFKSPRLRLGKPGNSTKLPGFPPETEKIPPRTVKVRSLKPRIRTSAGESMNLGNLRENPRNHKTRGVTVNITEFLGARIAEDEALASKAARGSDGKWHRGHGWMPDEDECRVEGDSIVIYDEGGHDPDQADHIATHDPARVLAECAAKRAIVGDHIEAGPVCMPCEREWPCPTLRHLAAVYSDHPDYQQGWVA